jgi:deoxyuridine 5'-triphosphate nucleotidohydrolase
MTIITNHVELPYYCAIPEFNLEYHHNDDAGLDLPIWDERLTNGELSTTGSITLASLQGITLKTGIHMAIPKGHYGLLDSRSSTSKKRLDLLCRIIDSPFRGNIRVAIINLNNHPVTVSNKDELFQIIIQKYTKKQPIRFETYEEFLAYAGTTKRGQDGFGSKERKQQEGK